MQPALARHDAHAARGDRRPRRHGRSRSPAMGCTPPSPRARRRCRRAGRPAGARSAEAVGLPHGPAAGAHGAAHRRGRASATATTSGRPSTASRGCWRPATAARSCSRTATCELVRDHLPPGAALRDLGEHRLNDLSRPSGSSSSSLPTCRPTSRRCASLDARRHNLPLQLTSFVGRERELAAVARLLRRDAPADADRPRRHRQDPPGAPGRRRAVGGHDRFPTASGWSSWRRWPTRRWCRRRSRAHWVCAKTPAARCSPP